MLQKFQELETSQHYHSINFIKKAHQQHTMMLILSTLTLNLVQYFHNSNIINNGNSNNNYENKTVTITIMQ